MDTSRFLEKLAGELVAVRPDGIVRSWGPDAGHIVRRRPEEAPPRGADRGDAPRGAAGRRTSGAGGDQPRVLRPDEVACGFRAFLDSAPDAMVVVGADGRIVLCSGRAERLFGFARDELAGAPVETLVAERHRAAHAEHRRRCLTDPRARTAESGLELHGLRRDGTEFPAEISVCPVETGDGVLVACAVRDVSTRKRREIALAAANEELESFSYSVAHDLRAPLRAMDAFAQILIEEHGKELVPDVLDGLRALRSSAGRMAALVDALLSLARVTRGELRVGRTDLSALVRESAARAAAAEPHRDVRVEVEDGLFADADPGLTATLIDNLVGNAWKFTARTAAARIEFGCRAADGETVYFVRDNGAGFDMAHASRLFGAFQRLHSAEDFPGTGIGLATAQRIVHRHGGRIWAEGRVAAGAVLWFTLRPTGAAGAAT